MPAVAAVTPRKMLPPPMTMAISIPICCTSTSSSAMVARTSASIPVRLPPIRASPESLRRMRLNFGAAAVIARRFIPWPQTRRSGRPYQIRDETGGPEHAPVFVGAQAVFAGSLVHVGTLAVERFGASATLLDDGRVLVA